MGEASISRDPLVQQLKNTLRSTLLGAHANSGAYGRLAEIGIGFDRYGHMVVDQGVFDTAVSSQVADVQSLFTGDDGSSGAFGALSSLVKGYTQSGGLVSDVRTRLTTQARSLANRMDAFEAQLEVRRLALQKEFQAADEAMSMLNAQVASLASLGNEYRLF
jgi:flagellar hook-associated protein 2